MISTFFKDPWRVAIICNILREICEISHHSVKWFSKEQSYFHAFANFHEVFSLIFILLYETCINIWWNVSGWKYECYFRKNFLPLCTVYRLFQMSIAYNCKIWTIWSPIIVASRNSNFHDYSKIVKNCKILCNVYFLNQTWELWTFLFQTTYVHTKILAVGTIFPKSRFFLKW